MIRRKPEKPNWREPDIYKQFNSREGIIKWKTTEEAAMAADLKAVGSTAADQEEHSQKVVKNVHLTATESRMEKDLTEVSAKAEKENLSETDHAEASVKAEKENHSATDLAEALAKVVRENHSPVREDHLKDVRKEEASVKAEKEGHSETDHAEALAKVVRESRLETDHAEVSAKVVRENHSQEREGHSVETGKDSAEREDLSEPRRASTRRISTISATRMRVASTR